MHYLGNGSHGSRLDPTFTRALMTAVRDRGHLLYMFAIRGTWAAATLPASSRVRVYWLIPCHHPEPVSRATWITAAHELVASKCAQLACLASTGSCLTDKGQTATCSVCTGASWLKFNAGTI
jgi:hypothetical protein